MILMCFLLFTGGRAVYATNPPAEGSTETDSSEEPDLTTISGYDDYMTEQAKEAIQDLSNKAAEEKLIDALHDKLSDESLNTVNDGNKIINEIAKEQSLNASVWKSLFSKACESHNVPKNKKEVDAAVDALNDATDKLHILWWDGDGTGTNISAMKVMIEKLLDPSSPAYTVMSMCTTLGATLCLVFSVMNIMEKATERSVSTEALWRSFLQMCLGIWIIYNCLYLASAIIYIGGNDSMDTIKKLSDYAILTGQSQKFVGVPKTIDNDLWGSDLTFGFHSAVDVATNAIDCIHTTAASHGRVFIVEIMGHKVGWLALYAGIAGGADIILLPEIPYDIDVVVNAIRSRTKNGKNFTILAVAEGAISKENAALTKKELKEKKKNGPVYPSVAYELGAQISERTGQEIRVTVPGHMQRGGEPCPYDRVIATRLGAEAAEMIRRKEYGYMVALNNNKIEKIPLADIAGKLKMVDPKSDIIREAKDVGISFGDE